MKEITLEQAIDDFIQKDKSNAKEKEQLQKLLKDKFIKYAQENGYKVEKLKLPIGKKANSTRLNQLLCCLEDIVATVLQKESRDKKKTAERLRKFITYLNDHYAVGFDIEEGLPKVFSYEAERQLDLLKAIHISQTKEELVNQYAISSKTLSQDLSELEMGKSFLGQNIKIDRLEGRQIRYVSSVHPVFMAMNLSEVFSLTIGLIQLGKNTSMEQTYTHLAHTIYNQLSPYAQKLIQTRGEELGIQFSQDKKYKSYQQEKAYKESHTQNALLYAVKSGERCKVTYELEGKLLEKEGYLQWRGDASYYLKDDLSEGKDILLEQEQIVYIEVEYK